MIYRFPGLVDEPCKLSVHRHSKLKSILHPRRGRIASFQTTPLTVLFVASLWLMLPVVSSRASRSPLLFLSSSVFRRSFFSSTSTSMAILESPSAERNKAPIFDILYSKVLPLLKKEDASSSDATSTTTTSLKVLEIAAGCGVHTEYFASKFATDTSILLEWHPTDPDVASRDSIEARIKASDGAHLPTIQPPLCLTLDANGVMESDTEVALSSTNMDLMICINMIHISPWTATVGLMKLAKRRIRDGGVLYCYGPYKVDGTAVESNLNFDKSLRSRNSEWGVRDLEAVVDEAKENGFILVQKIEMPANNLSLLFQKKSA